MGREIHYEVFRRVGARGGWTLHEAASSREGAIAKLADALATAEIAGVRAAFDELAEITGGDNFDVIGADLRFHQSIVALLGSPRLDAVFDSVVTALRPCLVLLSREASGTTIMRPDSLAEHEAMADAIAARKGREAERLLTAHIDRNQELLLEVIGADPTEEDE